MKKYSKSLIKAALSIMLLAAAGCNDVLVEQNRNALAPSYLETKEGVEALLVGGYYSFRFYYGDEGGNNLDVYGTDEFTHGQQVNNPPLNVYGALDPANGDITTPWNRGYAAINNLNGVIQFTPTIPDFPRGSEVIGEAKYLRAHWYLILVQQFGTAILSLGGAGDLAFNEIASTTASLAPFEDVMEAIINDLEDAVKRLPNRPSETGRVWKASALHLLSKAYLHRAWSSVGTNVDFDSAYNKAMALINNKGTYGVDLEADYADVHAQGNEYGKEVLFQVGYNDNQAFNNFTAFGGPAGQNKTGFFFNCFYEQNTAGVARTPLYGRVWVRYKPTPWLTDTAFQDKVNDTRFNKSFRTVWYCNDVNRNVPLWTQAEADEGIIAPGLVGTKKLALGDTAIFIVPKHLESKFLPLKDVKPYIMFFPNNVTDQEKYFFRPGSGIQRPQNQTGLYDNYAGVNTLIANTSGQLTIHANNKYYPSMIKYIDTSWSQGNVNNTSTRPYIVHRFAETYLLAAEALVGKGGMASEAATLVNVVRSRAGALTANTESDIIANGIDYILDERARELAGEHMRWGDLVRTGKLIERVKLHNMQAAGGIQTFHVKRPIPQGQIDAAFDPTTADGKFPQNQGYDGN